MTMKTKEFKNRVCHASINLMKQHPEKNSDLVETWASAYSKEHISYQGKDDKNGDDIEFATIYHALIHSPALETLLQLEHSYSVAVKDVMQQAETALDQLQKK